MNKETYYLLENFMICCMKDTAHDKEHVYRVLYNALEIAKTENNVNYDILIAACLLHDIGRKEQFENPALCHAIVGSEKAYQFLLANGFEASYAEQVKLCIMAHRYRKDNPPQSLEAKILFDADKLDAAGAVGIARTLPCSNRQGRTKTLKGGITKMTEVRFYESVEDELLKFAVIISKTQDKYVFCKHKDRNTWEVPGGHREQFPKGTGNWENILDTAKRELYEETGALEFDIKPICVYSVTAPDNFDGKESFGMLFFADIRCFETELHSEIEKIAIMDELPEKWTYPEIQPHLMDEAKRRGYL